MPRIRAINPRLTPIPVLVNTLVAADPSYGNLPSALLSNKNKGSDQHPPEAPWLRPPLRSLRWVDHFLASLQDCGFSDSAAVDVHKAFTSFLLGALLLRVAALGAAISPEDAPMVEETSLDKYPTLQRLRSELAEDHPQREFDDGLDSLIERIRTTLQS